jgi:hypothetical protein
MQSKNPFQLVVLFCLCSLLSACNQRNNNQNSSRPPAKLSHETGIDFSFPIEFEITLISKNLTKVADLCKVPGLKAHECTVSVSGKDSRIEQGTISTKTKGLFSKQEFDTLISTIKERYQSEGQLSYSIAQKKDFDFTPR